MYIGVTIPEGKRLKDLPAIFKAAHLGNPSTLPRALQDAQRSRYARGNLEGAYGVFGSAARSHRRIRVVRP